MRQERSLENAWEKGPQKFIQSRDERPKKKKKKKKKPARLKTQKGGLGKS